LSTKLDENGTAVRPEVNFSCEVLQRYIESLLSCVFPENNAMRRKWRTVANLITLTRKGWGRNPPRTPKEMASNLLDEPDFKYRFTGRIKHPGLKEGRVLIFRFMKTIVGEAVFERWLDYDFMYCKEGEAYPIILPSGEYLPRSANRYVPLSTKILSGIRQAASQIGKGGYVETSEEESIGTHRVGQGEIRRRALIRYGRQCALCKIDLPSVLVAGHIKGWAKKRAKERGQDENVILFCTLHDSLFGKGYLTLDYPSYRIRYCRNAFSTMAFKQIRSVTMKFNKPGRGAPAKKYLIWHRRNIFGKPLPRE
jgi:hypothetical protein